jgi:hypothetical protein
LPHGQETRTAEANQLERLQDRQQSRLLGEYAQVAEPNGTAGQEAAYGIRATAHHRKAQREQAMTRRKRQDHGRDLKRKWPHHVALPAENVRDPGKLQVSNLGLYTPRAWAANPRHSSELGNPPQG